MKIINEIFDYNKVKSDLSLVTNRVGLLFIIDYKTDKAAHYLCKII